MTSANPLHFDRIHSRTNVLRHFELVVKGGDYQRHKPHPEPYLLAAERLGVAPERCVAVEDSERGVEAAHRAGMCCLAIPNRLTVDGDWSKAHAVLQDVRGVLEIVEPWLSGDPSR